MAEKKPDYSALKKGGFMRQKQKGYFSLRLQVVGGNLTAENIRTVSEVADKYGKGYVHMTSRQGIEIPFIRFGDIEEVKEKLAEGGIRLDTQQVGLKQDIHLGAATMISSINEEMKEYDIEITAIHMGNDGGNKGLELLVTDEELLNLTGGIVQGMSGSPILQDGKVVGAVTHVLVNAPEKGYGIFIEEMLQG